VGTPTIISVFSSSLPPVAEPHDTASGALQVEQWHRDIRSILCYHRRFAITMNDHLPTTIWQGSSCMKRMLQTWMLLCVLTALLGPTLPVTAQHDDALVKGVLTKLNSSEAVVGSDNIKSYKILFDAYLKLTKPPFEVGPEFNVNTIHPKMSSWTAVSGWAESNAPMAQAILQCKDKTMLGLPYGRESVDNAYLNANLFAGVGSGGTLRHVEFFYLDAIDTISAFATAEVYRLMEAGQAQQGLDLAAAHAFVLRQCCDREFLAEKLRSIELLSSAMSNLRDVFYTYLDKTSADQYANLALREMPFLRPDRGRLFMPEADRVIAEALIREVFDERSGEADPDKFTETFAEIQSHDAPLTRFGAAKRWRLIAQVHGSLDACIGSKDKREKGRLDLIYDDWWRRWRVDAYDPILAIQTQFDRTNPIRYAAIMYSVQNVAVLFEIRNRLIAEVNGTALAAGLCAYYKTYNAYPDKTEKLYGQSARKRSDSDPYHRELQGFRFALLSSRQAVDTPAGRLWIEPGQALMWSQGQDLEDQRSVRHTNDGASGDMLIWPPIKALERAQGLIP
jgi:hypothetical protein